MHATKAHFGVGVGVGGVATAAAALGAERGRDINRRSSSGSGGVMVVQRVMALMQAHAFPSYSLRAVEGVRRGGWCSQLRNQQQQGRRSRGSWSSQSAVRADAGVAAVSGASQVFGIWKTLYGRIVGFGRRRQSWVGIWKEFVEFHKIRVHCLALQCERICGETGSGGNLEEICGLSEELCALLPCIAMWKDYVGGEVGVSIGGLGFAEGGRVGGICGFS